MLRAQRTYSKACQEQCSYCFKSTYCISSFIYSWNFSRKMRSYSENSKGECCKKFVVTDLSGKCWTKVAYRVASDLLVDPGFFSTRTNGSLSGCLEIDPQLWRILWGSNSSLVEIRECTICVLSIPSSSRCVHRCVI